MSLRTVQKIYPAKPTSDGAGVKLNRVFDSHDRSAFDPFLMLDEFHSDQADDYIAGFPSHPHRGFETVTYMIAGKMKHRDHLSNEGIIHAGDVQWMTAAHGIIHSEMPEQDQGLLHGFQLWLNLPASEKMNPPNYQNIPSTKMAKHTDPDRSITLISGDITNQDLNLNGPITKTSTEPFYAHIDFTTNAPFSLDVPENHTLLVYVFKGSIEIGENTIEAQQVAKLSVGTQLSIRSSAANARCIILSGKPINEPIAQWGPFVMNTFEEIEQAKKDYRDGTLTEMP